MKMFNIFPRKKYLLSIIILNGGVIMRHKNLFFRNKEKAEKKMELEIMKFRNFRGNSYTDHYQKEKGVVTIRHLRVFMKVEIEIIK